MQLILLNTTHLPSRTVWRMKVSTTIDGGTSPSPFVNAQAVEAWDTWFRWRDDGQLRDVTLEDTWERLASALAGDASRRPGYKRRLIDAFEGWHLLLDERVSATAGTRAPQWSAHDLHAVLNAASFVRASGSRHRYFDLAHFEEVAALSVHALDDAAALAADGSSRSTPGASVGIVGVSDALALLGFAYDSDAGRAQAANIAQAMAQGCLSGSIVLARDRGARARCDADWNVRAQRRGYRSELIEAATKHGLRHGRLTAIRSQPRLALFANGVADALDPLPSAAGANPDTDAACTDVTAQLRLRAAIQPWLDERIAFPLSICNEPKASDLETWNTLARQLDLAPLTWRSRSPAAPIQRSADS